MEIKTLIVFFLLSVYSISAQRTVPPSNAFSVEGKVKTEVRFSVADLNMFPQVAISDQTLYNHHGEIKGSVKDMKGVLLKTVLESIQLDYEKPRELNEFYFVFVATDGYKVVFSWNELYNTEVGNNCFIVTEMEGRNIKEMEQRILFISSADLKNGRRYLKALDKILVRRAEMK